MFKPDRSSLPKNPGIYIFKDRYETIIYIGKAKNLKNRISSYFSQDHKFSPKTQLLVKNITDLEYIIVDNEIEALLLENKLIKKHKPKYNINLKDSKTYAYIKITDEKIPKVMTTRRITKKGEYFGPYTDGMLRRELINLIVRVFGLITPQTYSTKSKLNYEIGLSPAPTIDEINKEEYMKKVDEVKEFLKGRNIVNLRKKIREDMKNASINMKYELALEKKNQLEILERIDERQKVDLLKNYDQDVVVLECENLHALIFVMNIARGVISKKKEFRFEWDEDIFESFIKMYYSQNPVPKEILVSEQFWADEEGEELITDYLSKIRGSKTSISVPKRAEKLSLLKLAKKNAQLQLKNDVLLEMNKKLSLPRLPKIIECFDMSNLGYDYLVGAMTRWVDAREDKSGYRKFEIKGFKGRNDDYRAMKETVYRRYKRVKETRDERVENKREGIENIRDSDLTFPDLIMIDGGKGQLNAALDALKELNLQIPIISVAKGTKRDKNEIYLPGKDEPFVFDDNSRMMLFIRRVRDSVHNFAINYNRKKREMRLRDELKK